VNSWPHLMRFPIDSIACILVITAISSPFPVAAQGPGPAPEVLYTASDFPILAEGVDPGFAGVASVHVWSSSQDEWSLTPGPENLTLNHLERAGDPAPRWQALGKLHLEKGRPLKIVVSAESPRSDDRSKSAATPQAKSKEQRRTPSTGQEPHMPVPALLWLTSRTDPGSTPDLDLIRGRVETIEPSPDRRRSEVRTNDQGADFQAPATAAAWRDRAAHLREQMLVTLGLWPMFPKTPLKPRIYGKSQRDGYTIEKVVLETFPGFTLSGNLYRPSQESGRIPGILCPHGHWADGRVNPEVQQRCIRWAKLGCVVFLYDMVGYNDSKPFPHEFLNDHLRQWGLSLPTLQTWNSIRALDWLTALPDVDAARIGCTGESGGGTQTFLLTALDARIKVSAPVVMVSDTFQGGCVCENAAGLRHGTDNVEFAALCAPRPLILVGASGDWTAKTMERAYPAIRGVYSLIGSTEEVSAQVFNFPHNYNQTTRNAVYAAMGHRLLGIEDPESTREGTQQPDKPEALLTFDSEHPAPPDRKTPEQLEAYLIGTLGGLIGDMTPTQGRATWDASRRLLLTSLKVRTGLVNSPTEMLNSREVRRIPLEEFTVVHTLLGRRSTGEAIPVVQLIPAHSAGRHTVIAHHRGKAALASGSGEPVALVRALLARGHIVVGFDPLFVGESIDARDPVPHRPDTLHFETYNPAPAVDQMQDLATVLAWSRAQPGAREVSLIAQGAAGYQALVARPLLENLARTIIELSAVPKRTGKPDPLTMTRWPATIDLPGLEQFGGPKAAAALSAPSPLWLYGNLSALDTSWPSAAYELAGVPSLLRIGSDEPAPDAIARWIDSGE
jgi:hypothetical protein